MHRTILGQSELDVPVFVIGTAPLAHVPLENAIHILQRGAELGATWWDTSDDYGTYPLLGHVIAAYPREQLIISSKTAAVSLFEGHAAIKQALRELQTAYLDMMFLHFVHDEYDLVRRQGCLEALCQAKAEGTIRAIGLSSHFAGVIAAVAEVAEIDVVMAPWNVYGRMPSGGSPIEMEHAIGACYDAGKGLVLMKLLASGLLAPIQDEAIRAGAQFAQKHALNIGVQSLDELDTDIRLTLGETVDAAILEHLKSRHRWDEAA